MPPLEKSERLLGELERLMRAESREAWREGRKGAAAYFQNCAMELRARLASLLSKGARKQ